MNIVGDFLRRSAYRHMDKTALVDGEQTWTYGELEALVRKVVGGMQSLGIKPGDRISYHGNNRWELVVTLLASIEAGTILVPLNVMLRPAELTQVLEQTGIRLILTTQEGMPALEELRASPLFPEWVSSYDDSGGLFSKWIHSADMPYEPVSRAPTDVVTLFFTSGTTGLPKGAPIDHVFIDHLAHSWINACRYTDDDIFLVATPMFWTVAPVHGILPIILAGGTIVLTGRFDPERSYELIKRWKITSFFGVPAMYMMILDQLGSRLSDLKSLRVCSVAGAPVAADVVERFEKLSGAALLNIYGATEAGGISRETLGAPRVAGATGPFGGTLEAKIIDEAGNVVPPGVPGEIVARGFTVIRGYWKDGKVDTASLSDGWFHTGDIGVSDQGFIRILDRAKDMIITGGANIYPAELEAVLNRHPKVSISAVVGIPDRVKGEVVVAYVIAKQSAVITEGELESHCRGLLSSYKIPRTFVVVNSLPMTPTGKIQKRELRKIAAVSLQVQG